MNFKEEYKNLLKSIKDSRKAQGLPYTNEAIAKVLNYTRTYLSDLIGEKGNVTADHINDLKLKFPAMSANPTTTINENEVSLRILIDNERKIVDTNARLVAMLEKVMNPTVTNLEGILTGMSATIQGIADTVVDVAAGVKYPSKEAAANKLHKNILTHQQKKKPSNSHLSAADR